MSLVTEIYAFVIVVRSSYFSNMCLFINRLHKFRRSSITCFNENKRNKFYFKFITIQANLWQCYSKRIKQNKSINCKREKKKSIIIRVTRRCTWTITKSNKKKVRMNLGEKRRAENRIRKKKELDSNWCRYHSSNKNCTLPSRAEATYDLRVQKHTEINFHEHTFRWI